ncbi:MAG: hypothetical protein JWN32_3107 [Solirubrobacterales bacterium]|nr:hypothetical protein [Solirubrobacterales bacterium]
MTRERLVPVLRVAGFALALAILGVIAARAARDVRPHDVLRWQVAVALVATVGWWLLLARGWSLLVAGRATRGDIGVWCRTQALRYLPGGIWAPVSRVAVAPGRLVGRISLVVAENAISLCAALAVGGVLLAAGGKPWWLPLVLVAGAPALASRVLAASSPLEARRVHRATANYLVAFALYVLAAALVQGAVSGFHHELLVAGAAAVAWGAGLVVVVAPSGVGVREVVYVALGSTAASSGELAAGAVTFRVLTILAELAVLATAGRPASRRVAPGA